MECCLGTGALRAMNQDNSVSIMTGYGLDNQGYNASKDEDFSLYQGWFWAPPIHWVQGSFFPRDKPAEA